MIVSMSGISKSFGAVEVLHGVDFDVAPGEVHVLAGENGAGKSTLVKILAGVHRDYTGRVVFAGAARIATIHQELSLVGSMSIADNLFLGCEKTRRFGAVDFPGQEREARRILAGLRLDLSPKTLVGELPVSVQQLLEIGRALARDARLLVLDEPTSALNEQEVALLFERIAAWKAQGRGIVYITHRIDEIYRLADRITVLRDGERVGTAAAADLAPESLVSWMVGREIRALKERRREPSQEVALDARVEGISFRLRRGEILGLAGLRGSGASRVLRALFLDPRRSIAQGRMLLPNDRKAAGLAPELSVTHNTSLASLDRFTNRLGWVRRAEERHCVSQVASELRLGAPSLEAPVRTLSGGNQQKVCLARCLLARPRVLLLDEPTRGVDIGAKADIYALMRRWTGDGISILLITSETDELLELCDRICVLYRGRIAAELPRAAASAKAILEAAMGKPA